MVEIKKQTIMTTKFRIVFVSKTNHVKRITYYGTTIKGAYLTAINYVNDHFQSAHKFAIYKDEQNGWVTLCKIHILY